MTQEELELLVQKYWDTDQFVLPRDFEHRFDDLSSKRMYALIREYKPKNCLEIGSWRGGSTNVIMAALQKDGDRFRFVSSELVDDLREATRVNVSRERGIPPEMIGDITQNLEKVSQYLDFLFLDDDHDLKTTQWIEEHIFPRLVPGALFIMHDWAVEEIDGKLVGKGANGIGGWEETQYIMDQITADTFPFKKLFYSFHNPGNEETGFWTKI